MKNFVLKLTMMLVTMLLLTGCLKHDGFDTYNNSRYEQANKFDYSTIQDVQLDVDYSSCLSGCVYFDIYAANPLSDDVEPVLMDNIQPVYSAYTDATGKFSQRIKLPSYAEHLYIYTGNFFVSDQLLECDVTNGIASVSASKDNVSAQARSFTRGAVVSGQTTSLETLYMLTNIVDWQTGDKTDTQIYKEWHTPLGSWDAETGRPSYVISPTEAGSLAFTSDEMTGIQQTIAGALTAKGHCDQRYRQPYDLTLKQNSEVAVTVVGSNSCWNSTMGYYYYTDTPSSTQDINIIMLFPNTQDGQSSFIKSRGNKYNGNIALQRGDIVKLMYYPNIASGDYSGATSVFPAGTKIGFILKSNGWGMQKPVGDKVYYNSYKGEVKNTDIARQYNSWAASTDGLSYCLADAEQSRADNGIYSKPNSSGQARTAKFAYENADGQQYAIVSFEDACNDDDYDDIVLTLKPVGVFEDLPTPEPKKTSVNGVYAFEDLWPAKGDYDLNDAVVDYQHDYIWSALNVGADYKITKEVINLTTYLNYVTLTSGLAVTVNTKTAPSSVKMKTIKNSEVSEVQFEQDGNVYLLTDNILANVGTQYIIELYYSGGIAQNKTADVYPFIYRNEDGGRWEVHIPFEAPTSKMITGYFGTLDDCSDINRAVFYVRAGNYPFAFYLSGVNIDPFKNTILLRANESKHIDVLYPEFMEWATSGGTKNKSWYLHPISE
jgi:LruC domain-containing protein